MATDVATELEALGVYWVEEPLHRGDYAGYAELRRRVGVKIAGGEMTREPYEFRELLERDCLDVFQPDCVCSQGITGLAPLARQVVAAGKLFTPHTWGNGIGVLANMHLTAGTAGAEGSQWLEFPYDPPEWSLGPARLSACAPRWKPRVDGSPSASAPDWESTSTRRCWRARRAPPPRSTDFRRVIFAARQRSTRSS